MMNEQENILIQIVGIAKKKEVDGVLIAGDLYDKTVPPIEAVQLLDFFLMQFAELRIPVYLISGNHDSAERLSFGSRILAQNQLYFGTSFTGVLQKMMLQDSFGSLNVYFMPFLKPAVVRPFFPTIQIETYQDAIRAVMEKTAPNPKERNLLIAHQFVTHNGTEPMRCDSETISIGGVDQIDTSLFDAFDYVALGHLHGPQSVGRDTIRYCGSPLKYSFSEAKQQKSVTIVTLGEKDEVFIETEPLYPLLDLREIRGNLEDLLNPEVVAAGNPKDYIRVILTDSKPQYDPLGRLRAVYPNIMCLDMENSRTSRRTGSETAANQVKEKTPLELFESFYEMANGEAMTDEEISIIQKLLEEMAGDIE